MSRRLVIRRLWWKDFRLVLPLVITLVAIGIPLLATTIDLRGSQQALSGSIVLLLPFMFALGVGALLIGIEKERRTLSWLINLPVAARDVIGVKLGVSLVGLAIMWIASFFMGLVVVVLERRHVTASAPGEWIDSASWPYLALWVLQSVLTLYCGCAVAWRVKSALAGLLITAFAPIAPLVMFGLFTSLKDETPAAIQLMPIAGFQLLACLFLHWYGYRAGARCLGVVSRHNVGFAALEAGLAARRSSHVQPSPWFALVWQHVKQHPAFVPIIGIALAVGMLSLLFQEPRTARSDMPLVVFLAGVASSVLGVLTFQGDSAQQRIRFLADRGVPAGMTWITRQVAPLAACLAIGISIAASARAHEHINPWTFAWFAPFAWFPRGNELAALAIAGLLMFTVGQWTSQLIASPIVSTIAAPCLAASAFFYAGQGIKEVPTPIWLVAVGAVIPFVATYVAMQNWMDRRLHRRYWGWHAGCLAVFLLLPFTPWWLTLVTEPKISAAAEHTLRQYADRWSTFQVAPWALVLWEPKDATTSAGTPLAMSPGAFGELPPAAPPTPEVPTPTDTISSEPAQATSIDDQRQIIHQDLRRQLNDRGGPLSASGSRAVIRYLQQEIMLARYALESGSEQRADEFASRYRNSVDLLMDVVKRVRLSPVLEDQDSEDQLDIWLLKELQVGGARAWLGDSSYQAAVRHLSDTTGRDEARRRAVVLSWKQAMSRAPARVEEAVLFGGYALPKQGLIPGSRQERTVRTRQAGRAAWLLFQLLANSAPPTQEQRESLATFWNRSPEYYGLGTHGPHYHADDVTEYIGSASWAPASQWHAGWEEQARQLERVP